jgi:hypothetical protein
VTKYGVVWSLIFTQFRRHIMTVVNCNHEHLIVPYCDYVLLALDKMRLIWVSLLYPWTDHGTPSLYIKWLHSTCDWQAILVESSCLPWRRQRSTVQEQRATGQRTYISNSHVPHWLEVEDSDGPLMSTEIHCWESPRAEELCFSALLAANPFRIDGGNGLISKSPVMPLNRWWC